MIIKMLFTSWWIHWIPWSQTVGKTLGKNPSIFFFLFFFNYYYFNSYFSCKHFIFTIISYLLYFLIWGCLTFFLWIHGGEILIFWKIPGWHQQLVQSFCLAIWQRELQGLSLRLCVRTLTNRVSALLTVGITLSSPRAHLSCVFALPELTPVMRLSWAFTSTRPDEMCHRELRSWVAHHWESPHCFETSGFNRHFYWLCLPKVFFLLSWFI